MKNSDVTSAVASAFLKQSVEYLVNHYQLKIEGCLTQLSDEQVWWRPNLSSNSIGNLVLHVCGNARQWIVCGLGDEEDKRVRSSEFEQTEIIPRAELLDLLRKTLADVRHVLENLSSEVLLETRKIQGKDVGVLEAVFHVTEHFAMHTGQIITLTKLLIASDLRFYDFEDTRPIERWRSGSSDLP